MPYRGRRLDCYDAGTFCPPAQRYMSSAEAAVPTPIKRRQEVRLPGTKLTGNALLTDWAATGREVIFWGESAAVDQRAPVHEGGF